MQLDYYGGSVSTFKELGPTKPSRGFTGAVQLEMVPSSMSSAQYHRHGLKERVTVSSGLLLVLLFEQDDATDMQIERLIEGESVEIPQFVVHRWVNPASTHAEFVAEFNKKYTPKDEPEFDTVTEALSSMHEELVAMARAKKFN